MRRVTMQIDRKTYALAQGQDTDAIEQKVVEAARDGADMVTVTLVGNRELDILVSPGVPITFESEDVAEDDRDDGDLAAPFDSLDDHHRYLDE
jgi:hypothetical protein